MPTATHLYLREHGQITGHSVSGEDVNREGEKNSRADDSAPQPEGETALVWDTSEAAEIPENEDPARRRIVNPRRMPRWKKILRRLFRVRELSPDELAERAEMEQRMAAEKAMREDAETVARRIINTLNALNLCYRYPRRQSEMLSGMLTGIQELRFSDILLQPDAIMLKAATPFPRGVSALALAQPDTLTNISLSVGRQTFCKYSEEIGFWFIIPRAGSFGGIPGFVKYAEMMEHIPATADGLTIPLGVTSNGRRIYKSIVGFPHGLIAGATGTGKSNFMNIIIPTLIQRNSPEELRLILVDLKGGMEMSFYEGLPHLLPVQAMDRNGELVNLTESGIIDRRDDVPAVLDWLIGESEKRMAILKDAGYKELGKYNARRKKGGRKMPRLVLVIDELADVKLAPKIGQLVEDKLANLAARSRAVGIHVIVATQSPKKEVIGTLIKTNLPAKFAFSMPSITASILILDNGDAKGLAPAGRMIYQNGQDQLIIQTPFMPDETLKRIINDVREAGGKPITVDLSGRDVTLAEVLDYSLEFLGGSLSAKKLHAHFRERISYGDLNEWMESLNDQQVEHNGIIYNVEVKNGRAGGRMLIPVRENDTVTPVFENS